jgi:hypothetical protein
MPTLILACQTILKSTSDKTLSDVGGRTRDKFCFEKPFDYRDCPSGAGCKTMILEAYMFRFLLGF